jgi:hypothetical protein
LGGDVDTSSEKSTEAKTKTGISINIEKPGASVTPIIDDEILSAEAASLEGLTLQVYAKENDLSESDVWKLLRQGELVGRTHRGQLIIYPEPAAGLPPLETKSALTVRGAESSLPPLPGSTAMTQVSGDMYMTLNGEKSGSPEVALLIDHLSLAKEENREILKMTQESIRKVSELSDSVIEMKDAVIDAKDAQLQALKEQLKATDRQNAKLKQDNEDLNMLARTLAENS